MDAGVSERTAYRKTEKTRKQSKATKGKVASWLLWKPLIKGGEKR